jgi:nucleoside-diphosphate-sugar epimerase
MSLNPQITDWNGRTVWLLGASTGIGRATAALLHARGAKVVVSARNAELIRSFEVEHPGSIGLVVDATDRGALQAATQRIVAECGRLDLALYCAGHYNAMRATAFDLDDALRHNHVNYVGALHFLDAVLPVLLKQKSGHISLVSSVAGYRGLPQSLAYGPTKAALINPGFVATPLTANNQFAMPGLLTPEQAAQHILTGWAAGRFEIHFPKRFTLWLKALGWLSDGLYFRAVRKMTGL